MPTLSNGSELMAWEQPDPMPTPDEILFSIVETDGDAIGPVGTTLRVVPLPRFATASQGRIRGRGRQHVA